MQIPVSLPRWVPTSVMQNVPITGLPTAMPGENFKEYNKKILREKFKLQYSYENYANYTIRRLI